MSDESTQSAGAGDEAKTNGAAGTVDDAKAAGGVAAGDEAKPSGLPGPGDDAKTSGAGTGATPPAAKGRRGGASTGGGNPTGGGGGIRVRCTLENCGDNVNGVVFKQVRDPKGKVPPYMLSDEITQEQADGFLAVPGFALDE